MLAQPPLWFIIIAFLCALGPLVLFHELGHYWVARWLGVGAEQFSIGFGREVAGWTDKRGTRWKIGWLPLGGYVRFVGDMNAASQPGETSKLPPEIRAKSFHLRPWWHRFLIVLAGPVANFILAIAIFAAFFAVFGEPRTSNMVSAVIAGGPADIAGIEPGDRILSVANRATESFEDVYQAVTLRPDENVDVVISRDGEQRLVKVRIGVKLEQDRFGQKFKVGRLEILGSERQYVPPSAVNLIPSATAYTFKITQWMIDGIWQILSGRRSVKDLGGPLKMAQIAGQQASLGPFEFIQLIALFSINLGFINLLPVPVLDGGHLVFYAAEAVRRRPVSERAQEWAFRGGLALLLALLIMVTVNDLASFGLFERLGRLIG
ncbi:RIP metalloprotease RseP [Sphingomonas sp. RB56-2]|uniref:Zinc metalloprotease n=1 Tax=Sphingomonas brevis TaxID=2908206 RepID=A0ABT0S7D6_9SPHN|nr:RIP metalloprotease RseP [Sphingomonas brevis]MCL6740303.1 RIP metalloprotease RseP [Sphingomonas brevis]